MEEHHHCHHEEECCEQEHHHSHGEHSTVHISRHEEALVASLRGEVAGYSHEITERLLAEAMRDAGHQITEAGGIIGHIKFLLTGPGPCSRISVTEETESIRRFEGSSSRIEGVAIVFGLEEDLLADILDSTIGNLLTDR